MKKNEKGFVLIELLIVAVFTATLFTLLYTNVIPLIGDYNQRENYDTSEIKYALYDMRKEILATDKDKVWNNIKSQIDSKGYARLYTYDKFFTTNSALISSSSSDYEIQKTYNNLKNMISSYNFISLYATRFGIGEYAEGTKLPTGYKSLKQIVKSNEFVDANTPEILKTSEEYTQQYIKQMKNYTLGYEYKKDYYRLIGCVSNLPTKFNEKTSYTSCGTIELMKG